ncbi:MAG: hypothetical protein EP147_02795 [Subdoligranulum sp.]|nr:hypothetical protein [Subdoligranulum sp.]
MGTGSSDKNYLIELDCSRDLAAIFILVYHFIIESNTAGYIHFLHLYSKCLALGKHWGQFILFAFWGKLNPPLAKQVESKGICKRQNFSDLSGFLGDIFFFICLWRSLAWK